MTPGEVTVPVEKGHHPVRTTRAGKVGAECTSCGGQIETTNN